MASTIEEPVDEWVPSMMDDPERRERRYLIVSVDDHVVEPPHLFEGRVSKKYGDRVPHVVDTGDGHEAWLFDGTRRPNVGFNATVGRSRVDNTEPINFKDMRASAYDIHARIKD